MVNHIFQNVLNIFIEVFLLNINIGKCQFGYISTLIWILYIIVLILEYKYNDAE